MNMVVLKGKVKSISLIPNNEGFVFTRCATRRKIDYNVQ